MNTEANISRKEFLKNLGLSSTALWAIYCSASLSSCKNETLAPTTQPSKIDFTLDLTAPLNASLKTKGGFVVKNDVVIANTMAGKLVAVSLICSHQQNKNIIYANGEFACTVHGSRFDDTGKVLGGPAKSNITQYQVSQTNNTLRIFEA